jgi:hypothetical protein
MHVYSETVCSWLWLDLASQLRLLSVTRIRPTCASRCEIKQYVVCMPYMTDQPELGPVTERIGHLFLMHGSRGAAPCFVKSTMG